MAIKARAEITLSSIRDIQSVTRYYLLQSSTSTAPAKPTKNPPGGNWVTTEPTYTSGSTNSLYFTDCTVFSDGSFVYSDVSLSSSYEAAKVAYNKAAGAEDVATAAQETANGKNTVYYQASAPSGGTYKVNDIWFETDNGNKMYMWNGNAWTAETFGTAAISNLAITNAKIANGTIENAKIANLDAGKVTSGTMSAARIKGDELKLGGDNNTDGVMKVYNANGELVGSFTKEGLMAIAGTIGGWNIDDDALTGTEAVGTEYWETRLSKDGLRFKEYPQGSDPLVDWTREIYYNRGLIRYSSQVNGESYSGVLENWPGEDGLRIYPKVTVGDQLDSTVTVITNDDVNTPIVRLDELWARNIQQPILIMKGNIVVKNGSTNKNVVLCTIPTAYQSGYHIVPFVTRIYGGTGVPDDAGDFKYAYYNQTNYTVNLKLFNNLTSGVWYDYVYFIYALPKT